MWCSSGRPSRVRSCHPSTTLSSAPCTTSCSPRRHWTTCSPRCATVADSPRRGEVGPALGGAVETSGCWRCTHPSSGISRVSTGRGRCSRNGSLGSTWRWSHWEPATWPAGAVVGTLRGPPPPDCSPAGSTQRELPDPAGRRAQDVAVGVQKAIDLTGTGDSIEDAVTEALDRARLSLEGITSFEVVRISGVVDGSAAAYEVHLRIWFTLLERMHG